MPAGPNGSIDVNKPARKKRGGQPGNTNAFKLKRSQSASA